MALGKDGELLSLRESTLGRNHANNLALYVQEILDENDLYADELDAVAVSGGPGSYTGLRIGTAMAKSICYSLEKPMIAVGSLTALAEIALEEFEAEIIEINNPHNATLCPMIDARRMEVYTQLFDMKLYKQSEIEAKIIDGSSFKGIENLVIFGDGAAKCTEILCVEHQFISVHSSARGMVRIAEGMFNSSNFVDVAYYEPYYLKDFVATTPKRKVL